MMVHNNDIALRRLASHLRDEAALVIRAALPQACIAARIEFRPYGTRLGKRIDLRTVAGFGCLFPFGNRAVLLNFFQTIQNRLVAQRIKLMAAKIIARPFM